MKEELSTKILEDFSKVKSNKITYIKLKSRVSVCRDCLHWQETKKTYRCFKCNCLCDFIFNEYAGCPHDNPKW